MRVLAEAAPLYSPSLLFKKNSEDTQFKKIGQINYSQSLKQPVIDLALGFRSFEIKSAIRFWMIFQSLKHYKNVSQQTSFS